MCMLVLAGWCSSSSAKHLESAHTMFTFVWWMVGFYWVSAGGETLIRDAPKLYWLVCFVQISHLILKKEKKNIFMPLFLGNQLVIALQGLYNLSCFGCALCCCMHRGCMPSWHCRLLLSSMHNCNFVLSNRSGNSLICSDKLSLVITIWISSLMHCLLPKCPN